MPKTGGFRPGAGRPKGAVSSIKPHSVTEAMRTEARRQGMTPLQYMLSVMSDPEVDPIRRDRMAVCAAPYCHAKADYIGKKEHDEAAAKTVDRGTKWERLLRRDEPMDDGETGLGSAH